MSKSIRESIRSIKKFIHYFRLAVSGEHKEFTTGNLNKAIFLLSVPMVLEVVLEATFAIVDAYFVSKVSVDAVATIGLTESVLTLVYSISIGLSVATTAMIARRVGEKNPEATGEIAAQAILITLVLSSIISVIGVFFAKDILRLLGGSEQLIESGYGYTRIMLGGNIVIVLIFLINGAFRGAGDASIAMRTLWLSNALNIVLDPMFIFGFGPIPAYGVEGAAVATTIGRGTGVLYQLYHLFNGKGIVKVALHHFKANWQIIKDLVQLSLGSTGQFLIESASWIFLYRIISKFGSEALAGYTIAIRVIIFGLMPTWGLSNAAATLVGQNLGAQQPDRAEKSVWRTAFFAMLFLLTLSILYFAFAREIMLIFRDEAEVVKHGILSLQVICLGYVFFAYGMVISQSLNGAGDTKTPMFINIICFWVLQIPAAYVLAVPLGMGPLGVYIAVASCFSIHALICIYVFRRGKWKLVKV